MSRWTRRLARDIGLLPAGLLLLAEAAWVAVVYALFQAAAGEPGVLGIPAFTVVGVVGALAGSIGRERLRARWPVVAVGLVAIVAVAGWLALPGTRVALASTDPSTALVTHPGGWLAGLAAVRGIAATRPRVRTDEPPAGSLVSIGLPALVASFLLGGAIAEPGRSAFRDAALVGTVVFVAAGLVGLALLRITRLEAAGGPDWRRNPAWIGLLLLIVAGLLVVVIPASFALGPVVVLVLAALPVPLFIAGLFAGLDRRALRILLITIGFSILAVVVLRLLLGTGATPPAPGQQGGIPATQPPDQGWMTIAGWILVVVGIAVAIAILAAVWMRGALAAGEDDVAEERTIDRGGESPFRLRLPALRPRRLRIRPPTDAVEAYLAAIAILAPHDDLSRRDGETPAEHAGRLRREARVAEASRAEPAPMDPIPPALARLAADYELARFGGRALSGREQARAVGRWVAIRAAVARRRRVPLTGDAGSQGGPPSGLAPDRLAGRGG